MALLVSKSLQETEFNKIYSQYHQTIFRNIKKLIYDDDLALDILQEVFITLWNNREYKLFDKNVSGWLFTVSYNKSIDFLRRKITEELLEESKIANLKSNFDESLEFENQYALKLELLEEAIQSLSPRKKEVFKLYRYEGLSKEEVAEKLMISKESVGDYLKQANAFIREYVHKKSPSITNLFLLGCFLKFFN